MSAVHQEEPFEAAIEASLVDHGGWAKGSKTTFDQALGIDPIELFAFIRDTQPDEWVRLVKKRGGELNAGQALVERVVGELDARGTVDVLRHGVRLNGERFTLVYLRPTSGISPELIERYRKNRLAVVRQLVYSEKTDDELDLAFLVNGIPTHDAELKNPLTGQNVEDAKDQYRHDRNPREKFFAKRSFVHFAVDPDEVAVTTLLEGADTTFVPFNLGRDGGAGNPAAKSDDSYATSYLWEELWQRDAWLLLLQRFVHVSETEISGEMRRQVIFPRYHQWDAVRKLVDDARKKGPGQRYLIEHSAGSGKSNSIAWLAYSLMSLHDGQDRPVFDKVIVVSDRRNLDKQLRDTVKGFEHTPGIVEAAERDSRQLAKYLESTTAKVVVTTLWKFPVIVERAQFFQDSRYAVIIDEAHSSQTGEAATKLKLALGKGAASEEADLQAAVEAENKASEQDDPDEFVERLIAARGQQPNISFFAFTATPKSKTLQLFGTKGEDDLHRAFHLYPMRQAIEEGFILDVLQNYTTYATYRRVEAKDSKDDPEVPTRRARAAIARFVSLHERMFAEKAEIVAEHFLDKTRAKIGGKAKAMWVTASRLHAVRSYFALKRYVADKGYDIGVLIAFSGSLEDGGVEYTEHGINDISEGKLPDEFKKLGRHILVVAEKYQTGYDEPLLHTMFVDKKLENLKAVQTLSRLNRTAPGKEETFILDFVNDADEIQEAFRPYFEGAETTATDPALLDTLMMTLDGLGVVEDADVEGLIAILANPKPAATDHARLYRLLEPAVTRFKKLSEDDQETFRDTARNFVRLYAFLGQILDYTDPDAEKRFAYVRALLHRLPERDRGKVDLGDKLLLTHLRLEKTGDRNLSLTEGGDELPGYRGTGRKISPEEEQDRLSVLIKDLNERFGTNLGKADQLSLQGIVEDMSGDQDLAETARANNEENFRFAFAKKFEPAVLDRFEANEALFGKIFSDPEFKDRIAKWVARELFDRANDPAPDATLGV